MSEDPLKNADMTPSKPLRPIQEGDSGENALGREPPSMPFSLKGAQGPTGTAQAEQISPMDLASSSTASGTQRGIPTPDELITQAQQINDRLGGFKQQLAMPGLKFKPSTSEVLSGHLNNITDNLSIISSRLSTPAAPRANPADATSAIEYFLNYLTGSQQQLNKISQMISHPPTGTLQPGDLLAIQVKMTGVQQQMEFFSVLLGKAIDNIKTVMSIQS
jgi:hypothetical protein